MIEKKEHYNKLLDVYGDLLTSHQVDICRLYYQEDLSLQEIAENYNISRNAVFDNIKRVETILDDYENKLGLVKKENKENKKKILLQIDVPLKDKEKLANNECMCFNDKCRAQYILKQEELDEKLNELTKNLKHYQIYICKIEKEVKE